MAEIRSPVSKELSVFSPSPDDKAASFCERPDIRRSSRSLSTRSIRVHLLSSRGASALQWDLVLGARTVFAAIGGLVACFDCAAFFLAASIAAFATVAWFTPA